MKLGWKTFSLRTLMICVLLLGFSWTATAVWGTAATRTKIDYDLKENDYCLCSLNSPGSITRNNYQATHTAIAPFLIRVDLQNSDRTTQLYALYLWVPAWTKELSSNFVVAVE